MKRWMVCLILSIGLLTGCAAKKTSTAPIPGSINSFDATTYRVLADAQAAINSIKGDLATGKLQETPTLKAALNQVIQDYNAANALYQAYHASAGATSQTEVQTATNKLQVDTASMTALAGGTK